jgi:hypothetical protein
VKENEMAFEIKIRDGNLPTGKGTFLWLLPRLVELFGSLGGLVDQLAEDGYQWVCIKAHDGTLFGSGYDDNQVELLDQIIPLLDAVNIEAHGWGYNYGNTTNWLKFNDQQGKETARIVEALVRWPFRSWTLNAEKEFKVTGGNTAAVNLINLVRETLSTHPDGIDVPVGLSTFRFVSSHPEFPFAGFLGGCDFAGPQVYWQGSNFPVDQLVRSVNEWKAIADLPMVVAGTTYPEGAWWPTGDQLVRFNEAAKEMENVIATCYWEHYYPLKYEKEDLVAALQVFDWPAVVLEEEVEEPPERVFTEEELARARAMLARLK